MIRSFISLTNTIFQLGTRKPLLLQNDTQRSLVYLTFQRCFSSLQTRIPGPYNNFPRLNSFNNLNVVSSRTITKYSMRKGKRKTCKAVVSRFYRLHWGIWIRRRAGCKKKLWKKRASRKRRLRQHVFCNSTQSYLLDKMVNNFWRRPKYYVNDPYEPYHTREEFQFTYRKPRPYFPPEEL